MADLATIAAEIGRGNDAWAKTKAAVDAYYHAVNAGEEELAEVLRTEAVGWFEAALDAYRRAQTAAKT